MGTGKTIANVFGLLIIGLILISLFKHPQAISNFFNGTQKNLSLLTQ